jgi:hypothetical protein
MWDLTVPGNNDHDFYVIPTQPGRYYSATRSVAVLVHNSSRQLGCNLTAAGEEPNISNPEAHHIVPESHPLAVGARTALDQSGIGIDSAENGVWISRLTHIGTFSNSYVQWINDEIVNAGMAGGKSAILEVLGDAKSTLQALDQNFGNGL